MSSHSRLNGGPAGARGDMRTNLPSYMEQLAGVMPIPATQQNNQALASYNKAASWMETLFGRPPGQLPTRYGAKRNISIADLENAYQHEYIPLFRDLLTYKIVTAMGSPLLQRACTIKLSYVQQAKWSQTSYNLIPAQDVGPSSQARYNTRNTSEWAVSGRRVASAALERMEILMSPDFGMDARDWMINSAAASLIVEMQHSILNAATIAGTTRYWQQTDGFRTTRFAQADKQLMHEKRSFGAFNRGYQTGGQVLAELKGSIESPNHIAFLPYSMRNSPFKTSPSVISTNPVRAAKFLEMDQTARTELQFNIQRTRIYEATPQQGDVMYLGGDSSTELYYAPPSTLTTGDDGGPGILNSYTTVSNYFRNASLRDKQGLSGDLMLYDPEVDAPAPVRAKDNIQWSGWWNVGPNGTTTSANRGRFPNVYDDTAVFSPAALRYIAELNEDRQRKGHQGCAPANFSQLSDVGYASMIPDDFMSNKNCKFTAHMHVGSTYWRLNSRDLGEYMIARQLSDMMPDALTHQQTLRAAGQLEERVQSAYERRLGSGTLTVNVHEAFGELRNAISTIVNNTAPSTDLGRELFLANLTTTTSPIDGVNEFALNTYKGLNIPVDALPAENAFFGSWTGPQLKTFQALDGKALDGPKWVRDVHSVLSKCIPVIELALGKLNEMLPETRLLATNALPPQFRNATTLTALIANMIGDTAVWVATSLVLKEASRLDGSSANAMTAEDVASAWFVGNDFVATDTKKNDAAQALTLELGPSSSDAVGAALAKVVKPKDAGAISLAYMVGHNLFSRKPDPTAAVDKLIAEAPKAAILAPFADGNERLAGAAILAVHTAMAIIGKNAVGKKDLLEKPELRKLLVDPFIGAIKPRQEVAGPEAGATWVRTPLGYAGKHILEFASVPGVAPSHWKSENTYPADNLDGDLAAYNDATTDTYVDLTRQRANLDTLVRNVRRAAKVVRADVAPRETRARGPHYGNVPNVAGPTSADQFSSSLAQQPVNARLGKLRQFRQEMYNKTNGTENFFNMVCWRAYVETPFTAASIGSFYDEKVARGIAPPVDVGFWKMSQVFRGCDMVMMAPYAVTMLLQPPVSYLQYDTTHKFVAFQTDKRSCEYVENPEMVNIAHSVWVEANMCGRWNEAIRPGDFADPDELSHFFNRNTKRSMLVVLAKPTEKWEGVMSYNNQINNLLLDDAKKQEYMLFSDWTSQDFTWKAFEQLFARGDESRQEHDRLLRHMSSNPGWNSAERSLPSLWEMAQARRHWLFIQPYAFQGYQINMDKQGTFNTRPIEGSIFSPTSGEYWNDRTEQYLLGYEIGTPPTKVSLQTVN